MAGGPAPGKLVWCTREEHDRRHGPPWWAMLRRPGAVRARDPAGRPAPAGCLLAGPRPGCWRGPPGAARSPLRSGSPASPP